MKRAELESKYLKNTINENKTKLNIRRQKNFCSQLFKRERKKIYSNLELNQITDNNRVWKTIKSILNNKCIQSFARTPINNENTISDDFKLA